MNNQIIEAIKSVKYVKNKYDELKKQLQDKEKEIESWKTLIDEAQIEQRKLEQECNRLKFKVYDLRHLRALDSEARDRLNKENDLLNEENNILKNTITNLEKTKELLLNKEEQLKKDVERWKSNFNGKVSAIEELIKIIQQALEDFSIEVGTPQYDRLLNSAKSLGIEVDNGTNP